MGGGGWKQRGGVLWPGDKRKGVGVSEETERLMQKGWN